jgi:hypothetical protein
MTTSEVQQLQPQGEQEIKKSMAMGRFVNTHAKTMRAFNKD